MDSQRDGGVTASACLFSGWRDSKMGRRSCNYGSRVLSVGATASIFARRYHEPRSVHTLHFGDSCASPRPVVFPTELAGSVCKERRNSTSIDSHSAAVDHVESSG